ncbi:M13 family metallopeptidase [Rhodoferax aquaticus]|uniref:M13 family metallopeptidase n=1 Tax=Rhodoferax aquaticus TaxID=2527691 RepID=UPI00143D296F|nr:M13 family metallopeptidase [Rhodoferax aquaticus]
MALAAAMGLQSLGFAKDAGPALGYSPANMDKRVSPREDFYRYANGHWLKRTDIPSADADVGGFTLLANNLNDKLLALIQEAANTPANKQSVSRQQIGDFYRAAMDLPRLDALGLQPIARDLQAIESAQSPATLAALLARLQLGFGVSPLLNGFTGADPKQSNMTVLTLYPGLQTLGQDEYASSFAQPVRALYRDYMVQMFQTLGDTEISANTNARTVMSIEGEIAAARLTPLQQRDPQLTYNKLSLDEAQALIPAVDLRAFITALGMTPPATVMVPDMNGLRTGQKVVAERSVEDIRTLLRWHVLSASASALGQPWRGLNQEFSRARSGAESQESREREVTKAIASTLFHPLSRVYVETYFPESTRRDITTMVNLMREEFAKRLQTNPWLDEPTRAAALDKLSKVDIAVGYPDQWIDFGGVRIVSNDYLGNIQRVTEFLMRRDFARLGQPVVNDRFAAPNMTTPIAVNAAYSPRTNSIDITAAIAQPPFYKQGADPAVNYCTMGAVIGHELTHGFDSFGRQFGPAGNLRDWWTPQATAEFTKRTDMLVQQYSEFTVLPGLMHNGAQTLTENTADLGGITLAHAALKRYLATHPQNKIDGLTSDQRCFVAWAQMWAYKARPERLRTLVATDYHAIGSVRGVAPLLHLDVFHKVFKTRKGDPMWRAPEQRVRIW